MKPLVSCRIQYLSSPRIALARVSNRPSLFDGAIGGPTRVDNESEQRFERAPLKFHQDIRRGYLALSKKGSRWCVIGADQAGHRIADAIMKRVRRLLISHDIPETLFKS